MATNTLTTHPVAAHGVRHVNTTAGLTDHMRAGCRVLHALVMPESGLPLDNLVIAPSGIYSVDAIRGAGNVKVRGDRLWLDGRDLYLDCVAAHEKAAELGRFMHHAVNPVLCVNEARLPAPVIHFRHVVVCTPDVLMTYINGGPRHLEPSWVAVFRARAAALAAWPGLPPARLAPPIASPRRAQHPSREVARPSTRRPHARPGRRMLATAAGTAVCIVGAWAVPALARLGRPEIDKSVIATEQNPNPASGPSAPVTAVLPPSVTPVPSSNGSTAATAAPPSQDPSAATVAPPSQDPSAAAAPMDAPQMLPTVEFTCPTPGQGWTATAVGAAFAQDPVGYHLWYEARDGSWQYWGQFMSGLQSPGALTGFDSAEELDVRIDRAFHENAAGAPTMLMFTAPDEAC